MDKVAIDAEVKENALVQAGGPSQGGAGFQQAAAASGAPAAEPPTPWVLNCLLIVAIAGEAETTQVQERVLMHRAHHPQLPLVPPVSWIVSNARRETDESEAMQTREWVVLHRLRQPPTPWACAARA